MLEGWQPIAIQYLARATFRRSWTDTQQGAQRRESQLCCSLFSIACPSAPRTVSIAFGLTCLCPILSGVGLYVPMCSMNLAVGRLRESPMLMRYTGWCVVPMRINRMATGMVAEGERGGVEATAADQHADSTEAERTADAAAATDGVRSERV